MAKPVTKGTLSTFLTAQGIHVEPGQDIGAMASNLLADWVAKEAAECPSLVKDPIEVKDQLAVFAVTEQALRSNPFSHAPQASTYFREGPGMGEQETVS